ncbi:MAG: UDP-N-acetylmuramoyl-tripeptide--D-alanyl-D-alanine ligase [Lautropia sp.]|jgi:UDP-N-acetylmuramoyl-tripeptide--D-alanyl-D-alanine ligase|uniref:UDP-N-acetylmuramoyl-tripeptide--D-alanyl-D-alanine ligase n=1 Tax=Lautropia dentalis TaxID=2490857 RepID=A0A3R8MPE5_9BURK|nr:UDP-N-acetylmuramoyl-tripeptide--D-alanyl-D-alanine ligase [Lautropia dentalis]RKW41624.1 MAG: UDP-N-acetylmuramoyl-tripeptide--D-alanyl-D-alanine ligase [Lautropia sp.]RRN43465.1 UDP-N-acetylmuramoyl-tripeptide--D-alanyl-D-alanine ligase [Lautropia dentalis]
MFDLQNLASWLPEVIVFGGDEGRFTGVTTDSRQVRPGDLYIALRGERFDGHDFIDAAIAAGAAGVASEVRFERAGVLTLWVPDTRLALGALAAGWRARFGLPLIAVTGSNGKTTVKEMIAAILVAHVGEQAAFATRGNFNNDIGVPLTLLRLTDAHRMGVVEMGMNHSGEIAGLAAMTRPQVALVLNAQREHQEFMDGPEATARENGSVFGALTPDGTAVFPGDDPCTPIWQQLAAGKRVMHFGLVADEAALNGADPLQVAAARDARPGHFRARLGSEMVDIRLNIAGRHNVRNALAAAACALALGIPAATIVRGLAAFVPVNGRLRLVHTPAGVPLIDDTYNANPDSMRAAIDVLADQPAPRLLVMGDMGETGTQATEFHREVGDYARSRGIEHIWTVGNDMQAAAAAAGERARHWPTVDALLDAHATAPQAAASVLVKGSRFMKMERIVQAWAALATPAGEH